MFVFSFVTPTADMSGNLETNFHTPTADGKYGATNGGNPGTPQYSNLEADRLIEAASLELDAQKRLAILRKASETIMADYAIAPLYYQNDIYGMSSKLDWVPRPDDFMTMWDAKWR
jgi:peptide/nickel transport system substrate-binding protein